MSIVFQWSPLRTCFMSLWKVAETEVNQNGNTFYFQSRPASKTQPYLGR